MGPGISRSLFFRSGPFFEVEVEVEVACMFFVYFFSAVVALAGGCLLDYRLPFLTG